MSRIPKDVIALIRTLEEEVARLQAESAFCLTFEGIVHNLKNSILGISAASEYITMLAEGAGLEPLPAADLNEIKTFSSSITLTSERMISMVQKILHKAGQDNCQKHELVDLNKLLRDELLFVRLHEEIRSGRIKLIEQLSEEKLMVEVVPHHISQIFANLIFNAVDALCYEGQGRIEVRSFCEDGFIGFEVSDNGPGIDEALTSEIFNPLYSSKSELDCNKGGSGLGLFTCRKLVRKYGGEIKVIAQCHPGCSFKVLFPQR